ncbi:MAG: NYN domain-containing protein, partial [Mycobacteriales bacterium]
ALAAGGESAHPVALGLAREDPAWLDALLAVPGIHLLVDGYNVTKTGFPGITLEAQRGRLAQGLAALVARTGAEITVVFDGAERTGALAVPAARGVRVIFSPAGRTADDVIVALVRAEPVGRAIAVVSADREVITRVERAGARGVPPPALLGLLGRK